MDEVTDAMLINAIRRRLLAEAERGGGGSVINNNVYGGGIGDGSGGLMGRAYQGGAGGGGEDPGDFDYFVDILREDIEPGDVRDVYDPMTGERQPRKFQREGWSKAVHRFRAPKKKAREE